MPTPPGDPAENLALRAIVMCLVAQFAGDHEAAGHGSAQDYIDKIAAIAIAAIGRSDADESLKAKAQERAHHILGGVHFPKG
jgi:hypothetical protein